MNGQPPLVEGNTNYLSNFSVEALYLNRIETWRRSKILSTVPGGEKPVGALKGSSNKINPH